MRLDEGIGERSDEEVGKEGTRALHPQGHD